MINSKNYFLIVKNWTKSILKLRFISTIFLFLIFVFASVSSVFLEIEKQIKTEFNNNKLYQNEDKNTLVFQGDFGKLSNNYFDNYFNLFCTDYFHFSFSKLEKVDKSNTDSTKIRKKYFQRLPKWTFGGQNSCFKLSNLKLDQLTFNSLPTVVGSNRMIISSFSLAEILKENQQVIKMNYDSPYYLNSLHGKIMQKYWKTEDKKYLNIAQELKKKFFYPVIKDLIEKEMKNYLTNLSRVYNIRIDAEISKTNSTTIQKQINIIKKLLSSNNEEIKTTDFHNFFSLRKKVNKIKEFLQEDEQKILQSNYQLSKKHLERLVNDLKIWEKNNLLPKFSPLDSKTKYLIKNTKKKKLLLFKMLEKKEISKIYFWLQDILIKISNEKTKIVKKE